MLKLKNLYIILFLLFFFKCTDDKANIYSIVNSGCTDETACNYNSDANSDDGSCFYYLDETLESISNGCSLPPNTLHLSNNKIFYNSNSQIAGIQFSLYGGNVTSIIDEGDLTAPDFYVSCSESGSICTGFSFSGAILQPGCGILMEFEIEGNPSGLSDIIVSNPDGISINFEYYGGCDCEGNNIMDDCGICGGDNISLDCNGVCDGLAEIDECGVCEGTGVDVDNDGICDDIDDCIQLVEDESCPDCFGVDGGTAQVSECLGCQPYPIYLYNCNDIEVLEQIANGYEVFSGLEPLDLGVQYWKDNGEDWRIYSLELSNLQLTTVPDELGDLLFLKYLYLDNNDIQALPDPMFESNTLEELYLQYNDLSVLPNDIGSSLASLKKINLTENELVVLPQNIVNLSNLEELVLYQNNLSSLPEDIGSLINLRRLDLGQNQLAEIPLSIGSLINLEYLFINGNSIFLSSLPDEISQLESLIELKMNNNIITSLPQNISALSNLQILNCMSNEINSLPETLCLLPDNCDIKLDDNNLCDDTLLLFPCISSSSNQNQSQCDD